MDPTVAAVTAVAAAAVTAAAATADDGDNDGGSFVDPVDGVDEVAIPEMTAGIPAVFPAGCPL